MKNNTKKIVVLDRLNSARIEQAIFILRDANDITESDAVSEAERIVKNFLTSGHDAFSPEVKKKKLDPRFLFAMFAYTLATVLATMLFISKFGA